MRAEIAGDYRFAITSDDGSELCIGDALVLNNGGMHPMVRREAQIHLEDGWHPLSLQFVQATGGAGCRLEWQPPGSTQATVIPANALAHGDGHLPGLAASGYALNAEDLIEEGIPPLLLAAAAERPESLALQNQVCLRAMLSGNGLGIVAAHRVATMALEGRIGGDGFDVKLANSACDT
ncbi:MAG: PA14 domain-containing protein, partial [Acidobacteriota bacterium]|nr:PA14 domain-containing protein [Acidobacteriota bacterium]